MALQATVSIGGGGLEGQQDERWPTGPLAPHFGHVLERLRDHRGGVLVVLELAGEVALVGGEVEQAVTAQVEDDGLPLALLLALKRLVDGAADGVGRFRRRQYALGARELDRRLECGDLGNGARLDDA